MALLQLASVRLLTVGLGEEGYAVYALLMGLSAWFTLADFGISLALQNEISESRARRVDYEQTIASWSTIAIAGGALLAVAAWFVSPWLAGLLTSRFPGIPVEIRVDAMRIMAVASISLASGSLIYKIWYGEHRGYLAHVCQLAAALLAYAGIAWILHGGSPRRLEWSVLAYYGINALLPLALLLLRTRRLSWPSAAGRREEAGRLVRRAGGFWGYGLMAALVLQLDYVLIATLLGPGDLVSYSIYSRLFGFGFFAYGSVLAALWPVLSEHATHGRGPEMLRLVRRHVLAGLAFMALFTGLVLAVDKPVFGIMSPTVPVATSAAVVLAMGSYFLLRVWTDAHAVMLQSMGKLRPFYLLLPLQALVSISGQFACVHVFGLPGVPLGMGLSFVLTAGWAFPMLARRHARSLAPSP